MNTLIARWPRCTEAVLTTAVTLLSVQEIYAALGARLDDALSATAVVVAAVAGLILPLRRRWPVSVTVVEVFVAGVYGLVWPLLVVLFHLATRARVVAAAVAAGAALAFNALMVSTSLLPALSLWVTRSYGPALLLILVLVLGMWAGSRRRLAEALASRIDSLHQERALREESARAAERAAIAAEMHDVLAHRLSLIALHTGVLATRADQVPPAVAERLALLRTASTDALTDLRDVLGALHTSGTTPSEAPPPPALRDVEELIADARRAGQHVDARVEGRAEDTPAAHRLAVHRLVREALTNARKHAPDAEVRLHVGYGPAATTLEVVNSASTRPVPGEAVRSGYGLVSLRERVAALGGHLEAGPAGGGAWRLAATLPVHTAAQEDRP